MNLVPTTGPQDEATTDSHCRCLMMVPWAGRDRAGGRRHRPSATNIDTTRLPGGSDARVLRCSARPVVRAAGDGLPLAARAAQGRGFMNVMSIAAAYGVVVAVFQWAWGSQLLGLIRPDQPLRADDALRRRVRVVHGLRGLPCLPSGRSTAAQLRDPFVADGLAGHRAVITVAAAIMIVTRLVHAGGRPGHQGATGSRSPSCSMPPSSACCWCRRRWSCSATATGGSPAGTDRLLPLPRRRRRTGRT